MSKDLTDKQKRYIRSHAGKTPVGTIARAIQADPEAVSAYLQMAHSPLDLWKKSLFTAGLVLLPLLFLFLLEGGLRLVRYGGDLRLFVPGTGEISDYYLINRDVARRYFFMQKTVPRPTKDLFLKVKPKNSYRIFVLGGSTTAGFPYGNNLTFSRILHHRLSETFPDLKIEVVNVAMSAISSYTLLDFMDEILDQKPDALLIYAGHNEFYGAMGVGSMESLGTNPRFTRIYLKLKRFRLFLLVRDGVALARRTLLGTRKKEVESDPTATLMERIVAEKTIPLDSPLYEKGKAQFQENLRRILAKSRRAGVPVVLSELVSNLRDQRPFVSMQTNRHPPAESVYREAQRLEQEGRFEEAKAAYDQAKDLDALRFRATEEFNEILRGLARTYQMPVVPMKYYFEYASKNGLIGDALMCDHLHPNMTGYFLMAEAFYQTMKRAGLIASVWPRREPPPIHEVMRRWGVTRLDTLYGAFSIRYLKGGWPFQPKGLPNRAFEGFVPEDESERMAFQAITDPSLSLEMAHLQLAEWYQKRGDEERALQEYRALFHMVPHEVLFYERAAQILITKKQFEEALPILQASLSVRPTYFAEKWAGQLLLAQGRLFDALPHLERAGRMQTPDDQLLYNLGSAYAKISVPQASDSVAALLGRLHPQSQYLPMLKSVQEQSRADFERVERLIRKAQTLLQADRTEEAEQSLLQAIHIQESRIANELLVQLYLGRRDLPKAIPYYEKVLYYTPNHPKRLYQLAGLYTRVGRPFKARDLLVRLEAIQPDYEDPYQLRRLFEKPKPPDET